MDTIRKNIFTFGTSSGIIIDKPIMERLGLEEGSLIDVKIEKVKPQMRITKSDGKISEGIFHMFKMSEGLPNLIIFMPDKDKSESIPFKIIKKVEEIK